MHLIREYFQESQRIVLGSYFNEQ